MDLENILREVSQIQKDNYYDSTYMVPRAGRFIETGSRGYQGLGWGESLFNGYRIFIGDEKFCVETVAYTTSECA